MAETPGEVKGAVEVYQEVGSSIEDTIKKIAVKFGLSKKDSTDCVEKFWKK